MMTKAGNFLSVISALSATYIIKIMPSDTYHQYIWLEKKNQN